MPPFRPRTNDRSPRLPAPPIPFPVVARETATEWWQPTYRPDFGGRPRRPEPLPAYDRAAAFAAPWSEERLYLDRAHVLRRLGRIDDADAAWAALAASPGRIGVVAAIELSKLREHRLRDPVGAFEAATRGLAAAERRRRIGRPEPILEANLVRRLERLRKRLEGRGAGRVS